MKTENGFTLIEVLIVVVIVGILMAVALPSYQESLNKGRRNDAKTTLQEAANRQERFMMDRSTYTNDPNDLGFPTPFVTPEGFYSITMAACAAGTLANCYTLTATPASGSVQEKDEKCVNFVLSSNGSTTATGTLGNACW